MKKLAVFTLFASVLVGEIPSDARRYSYTWAGSAASGYALTAQQPTTSVAPRTYMELAVVRCSTATTVTFEKGGTLATGSPVSVSTIFKENTDTNPVISIYLASNASAPAQSMEFYLPANYDAPFSLEGLEFRSGAASGRQLTVRFPVSSGNCNIKLFFAQK